MPSLAIAERLLRWVEDPDVGAVLFEQAPLQDFIVPNCPLRGLTTAQVRKLPLERAIGYVQVCDEPDVLLELADKERRATVRDALARNPHLPVDAKVDLVVDRWSSLNRKMHLVLDPLGVQNAVRLVAGIEASRGRESLTSEAERLVATRMVAELSDADLRRTGTGRWALPIYQVLDATDAESRARARQIDKIIGKHVVADRYGLTLRYVGPRLAERLARDPKATRALANSRHYHAGNRLLARHCLFEPDAAATLLRADSAWVGAIADSLPEDLSVFTPDERFDLLTGLIAEAAETAGPYSLGPLVRAAVRHQPIPEPVLDALLLAALEHENVSYTLDILYDAFVDDEASKANPSDETIAATQAVAADAVSASLRRLLPVLQRPAIVETLAHQRRPDLALDPDELLGLLERLDDVVPADETGRNETDETNAVFAAVEALATSGDPSASDAGRKVFLASVDRLSSQPAAAVQFVHRHLSTLDRSVTAAIVGRLFDRIDDPDDECTFDDLASTHETAVQAGELALRLPFATVTHRTELLISAGSGPLLETWLTGDESASDELADDAQTADAASRWPIAPATATDMVAFARTSTAHLIDQGATNEDPPRYALWKLDWMRCHRANPDALAALVEHDARLVGWMRGPRPQGSPLWEYLSCYLAARLVSATAYKALLTLLPDFEGTLCELVETANLLITAPDAAD